MDSPVFRNGFEVGRPIGEIFGHGPVATVYFSATNFLGTERYLQHHFDAGVGLEVPLAGGARDRRLRLRLGYVGGSGYDSARLEAAFHF